MRRPDARTDDPKRHADAADHKPMQKSHGDLAFHREAAAP
jgi:hypothetical protein